MAATKAQTIASYLCSQGLQPTAQWLESYIVTARPTTPLPALQKTALFRLLASDLCDSLQSNPKTILPPSITDPSVKERVLGGLCVPVQVLDIEDIGRSRWSQVELLEQLERGEMTKGREIIRLTAPAAGGDGQGAETTMTAAQAAQMASKGPHKLLLQDCKGTEVFGLELVSIDGVGLHMSIGTKLLLREPVVARGVVLLEPSSVTVLGGKVDSWDKAWRTPGGQKEALKTRARASGGTQV